MSEVATLPENKIEVPELNLDITVLNKNIADGLKKIEAEKLKIEAFKEEAEGIEIIDENDKAGYKKIMDFLSKVRTNRTTMEKERKAVAVPINQILKYSNGNYKAITSAYEEIEAPAKARKEWFEDMAEKRKSDEAAAQEKLITDKINLLCQSGLEYDANNGYYKNDVGIAVTRANIITLSEEDFNKLLDRVKARKEELDAIQKEADEKEALAILRRKELLSAGMKMDNEGLGIVDIQSGEELRANFDAVTDMSDGEFSAMVKTVTDIKESNAAYHEKIKAAAEETRLKAIELEKKEEKLKLDKVSVFKDKLEGIGFKFTPGRNFNDGRFAFSTTQGAIMISVGELLEDAGAIDTLYLDAENLNKAQEIFNLKVEKQAEINRQKAEETRKLEAQKALNTEARKKKMSRTDLAKIDPLISELLSITERIKATNFELIGNRILALTESIELEINRFNISVNHLRNN